MNILDMAQAILEKEGKPLHYREIATRIMAIDPNLGDDLDKVAPFIVAKLLANTKKKDKSTVIFQRIPNGNGGFKAGIYGVKKKATKPMLTPTPELLSLQTMYTGKAGEYGVFSELLYWGYNPAMMVVDDGIDIIASKGSNFFNIQVKTANPNQNGNFGFKITQHIFENHENNKTFYVLVLRRVVKGRQLSDYVIMPSSEIRRLINLNYITSKKDIAFSISVENNEFKVNGKHDLAGINDFALIR